MEKTPEQMEVEYQTIRTRWKNLKAPWRQGTDLMGQPCILDYSGNVVADAYGEYSNPISNAPTDIEWLIDEIEYLRMLKFTDK